MRIFCDRHHDGLAFSLRLLAKRLGAEIYFPIGEEWYEKGFWHIAKPYNDNPGTIKQYLSLDQRYKPADGTPPLNTLSSVSATHFEVEDLAHGDIVKTMSFGQFLNTDFDVIIGSIPAHWKAYTELRDKYKPKAKVVAQLGNIYWENEPMLKDGTVKNLLASVKQFDTPGVNSVFYHQEMPIVEYVILPFANKITSFVNCLPLPDLFMQYKQELHGFNMKAYGASCPDGWVNGYQNIYKSMQESDMGYHVKPHGDGMGHVWHSWFMIGRPVITNFSDYADKLGGQLFEHGVTGIDLERGTVEENCRLIRYCMGENILMKMSENARKRFMEVVNYDKEEEEIRKFLERLQ